MSQLLQLFALLAKDGTVPMVDGSIAPTGVVNGIPYDGVSVAVSFTDPISYYHQGLPFTAEGRVAIVDGDAVDHYGSGAAPIAANGRLIIAAPVFDAYMAVPYRLGRIVASEGTDPPDPGGDCYNFNSITEDQDASVPMWNPSTVDYEIKLLVQYDSSNLFNYVLASQEDQDGGPGAFDLAFLNDNATNQRYVSITVGGAGIAIASTGSPDLDGYGYIGDYSNGQLLDITVTMGAPNSYSAGFQGLAVINGVEYPFPNVGAFVGPGNQGIVWLAGFGGAIVNGPTYYVGVISDVYFTDFADPSNSRFYPIHEGTGSTFISQPAGNNIEITNHVVANWVDCPVVPAGDCYDFNSITQDQIGSIPIWEPVGTPATFQVSVEAQWVADGQLGYIVDSKYDADNGEGIFGLYFWQINPSAKFIVANAGGSVLSADGNPIPITGVTEGDWVTVVVTVGIADSVSLGIAGTVVVNGITTEVPNARVNLFNDSTDRGIWTLAANGVNGGGKYEGIIRDLTLTDPNDSNNDRYYPIDEGAGDTFISQPAGNNTVVTNHLPANWVVCPPDANQGVTITTQPADTTVPVGGTAVFTVAAISGDDSPLTYQWQYSGDGGNNWGDLGDSADLSGTTTDTVTLINFDGTDLTQWRCAVSNDVDTVTSDVAILYALAIIFDAPLQDSLIPEFSAGSSTPTFQRASVAYVTDYQGTLIPVLSGEARFQGARRVENLIHTCAVPAAGNSEDMTTTLAQGGALLTADTVEFSTDEFAATNWLMSAGLTVNDTLIIRAEVSVISGHGQFQFKAGFAGTGTVHQATSTPTVFSTVLAANADGTSGFKNGDPGNPTKFRVTNYQIERVPASQTAPSEYVSAGVLSTPWHGANVDGVQYFTTENNSYVDNGVVTEVYDTPITSGYYADAQGPYGYISESASTNDWRWSEDFTNALWNTNVGASKGTANNIGPQGLPNALSLEETAELAVTHDIGQSTGGTAATTVSVFLKAGSRTWGKIAGVDSVFSPYIQYFDLANGVVGTGAGAPLTGSSIEEYGNGWYRCSVSVANSLAANINIGIALADGVASYDGVVGQNIYVACAQSEESSFPTSYIKTGASPASRQADVLWYAGASNINYTEGTANVEMTAFWDNAPDEAYLLTSGTATGRIAYNFDQDLTELRQFNGNILTVDNLSALPNVMQYVSSQWGPGGQYLKYGFSSGSDVNTDPMGTGDLTVGVSFTKVGKQWNGTMRGLEVYSVEGETILIPPTPPAETGQANFRNGDEAEFRNTDNVEFI